MTSKITSKGQTTRPKEIRDKLPIDLAWHRAISTAAPEWDSANDHESFDDLWCV